MDGDDVALQRIALNKTESVSLSEMINASRLSQLQIQWQIQWQIQCLNAKNYLIHFVHGTDVPLALAKVQRWPRRR